MNRPFYFILALLIPLFMAIPGCVESLNSPDKIAPLIELHKPLSNDTVLVGERQIDYYASDDQKLSYIELWVNSKYVSRTDANSDGSYPTVEWAVDTSLVGKRVTYYLVAFDNGNNSAQSKEMSNILVIQNTKPPSGPKNLVVRKISSTIFNLSWDDSSDNELGFQIWRKTGTGGSYSLIKSISKNSTSTNDTTQDGSPVYYYKIRAVNDYGFGESNEVSTSGAVDVPVSNLIATAVGKQHIKLSWSSNQTYKLAFVIQRKSTVTFYTEIGTAAASATAYDDTIGLMPGTTYSYRVCARYQVGTSEWSDEAWVTTLSQDVVPPAGLTAVFRTSDKKVILNWTNFQSAKETRIERGTNLTGPFTQVGTIENNITTYTDSNVVLNTTYYYRVRNILWLTNDFTPYSDVVAVTIALNPPNAPGNLTLKTFSSEPLKYNLTWTDNSSDEQGFELWRQDGQTGTFSLIKKMEANTISTNDIVPSGGIIYFYKVRAYRDTYQSAFSNIVNTSGGSGTLAKPSNVRTSVTKNSVTIMWDYSTSINILGFEIQRTNYDGTSILLNPLAGASDRQYTDSFNLLPNQIYKYRIRANTTLGNSDWSDEVSAVIPTSQNLYKKDRGSNR